MKINRSHIPWAAAVALLSLFAGVLYFANFSPATLPFKVQLPAIFGPVPPVRKTVGGTPLGLAFGILALAIFIFAAALGSRKKRRGWKIGSVQSWLRAHIWLTIFTIPLVCFHSGFSTGGQMTSWVVWLYAIVMVSGFVGIALQQVMPSLMQEKLPREVVFDQIPYMRERLIASAEELWRQLAPRTAPALASAGRTAEEREEEERAAAAAAVYDPSSKLVAKFLHEECLPFLRAEKIEKFRLSDPVALEDSFKMLDINVTEAWRSKVLEMKGWCEDRRLFAVQTKMHYWMHGWLLIHAPISFALLVMTIWHAYVTLVYL